MNWKQTIFYFNNGIMKKLLNIFWVLMLLGIAAQAQNKEALEKIESARIALITERLELSPEQAEKFWPIYREYSDKRREAKRELMEARRGIDTENMTDEQGKNLMELNLRVKERMLSLEKEYNQKMLDVISSSQIAALRRAETDFNRMLLKRIQQRQQNQQRRDLMRERRQELYQQRNN